MMSRRFLDRWLVREILGEDHEPRRAARNRKKRGPARNFRYRQWIRSLPCCACGHEGSEAAHTGTDGGMSQKASDYSCVPLCPECHTLSPRAYHRIGKDAFALSRGIDFAELVRELNRTWFGYFSEVK